MSDFELNPKLVSVYQKEIFRNTMIVECHCALYRATKNVRHLLNLHTYNQDTKTILKHFKIKEAENK